MSKIPIEGSGEVVYHGKSKQDGKPSMGGDQHEESEPKQGEEGFHMGKDQSSMGCWEP